MSKSTHKKTDENRKDGVILIKKYPNRRLYNTASSAYIVLDDLIELIKSEKPFEIRDTKTDKDITREILNQIIFERETGKSNFHFPLDVQKQLIGMYDDSYAKMIPNYLKESLDLFASERDRMKSAMENVVESNTKAMMDYGQNMARQNIEIFQRTWEIFSGVNQPDNPQSDKEEKDSEKDSEELDDIQKQIDALQERLKNLK